MLSNGNERNNSTAKREIQKLVGKVRPLHGRAVFFVGHVSRSNPWNRANDAFDRAEIPIAEEQRNERSALRPCVRACSMSLQSGIAEGVASSARQKLWLTQAAGEPKLERAVKNCMHKAEPCVTC